MSDLIQLSKFGVTEFEAQHALDRLNVRDVDYADLYFESRTSESVSMEEGIVKRAAKSISQGVGVRATAGEKTGFAYSDELTKKDLEIAADTARYIANSPKGDSPVPVPTQRRPTRDLYPMEQAKAEVATAERVALLNEIDAEARRYDPRIKNVMASFNTEYKVVAVATSDGTLVTDIQPLSRLQITCIAEDGDNRQVGSFGGGGRVAFEFYREGRAPSGLRPRSGTRGDSQSLGGRRSGWSNAGRFERWMARHLTPRSNRTWLGSGLQSEENIGLFESGWQACGIRRLHDRG